MELLLELWVTVAAFAVVCVPVIVEAAAELIESLRANGVPGVHLYCLNRSETVLAVLERVTSG